MCVCVCVSEYICVLRRIISRVPPIHMYVYTEAYREFSHRGEAIKTCYYIMLYGLYLLADHERLYPYHLSFVVHKVRKTGIRATIIHARPPARRRKPCTSFYRRKKTYYNVHTNVIRFLLVYYYYILRYIRLR